MADGTRWSIDSEQGWDTGYLVEMRAWFENHGDHDTVDLLVANLKKMTQHSNAAVHIVGHGQPGMLGCGDGYMVGECYAHLDMLEAKRLAPLSEKVAEIHLWGCNVGAGIQGLEFMRAVAKATDAVVYAPTGQVGVVPGKGPRIVGGGTWQRVSSGKVLPRPIEMSKPLVPVRQGLSEWLRMHSLATDAGVTLSYKRPLDDAWSHADVHMLDFVNFSTLFSSNGSLGAAMEGVLQIEAGPICEQFLLLNGFVLQSLDPGRRSYGFDPALNAALASLQ